MDVFIIVILTLAIYSIIGTIAYLISKENESVAIAFGLGIAGLTVVGLAKLIHAIHNRFKYHIGKKSILEDVKTKKRYRCKTEYATDIYFSGSYKLITRYARKPLWRDLPEIDKNIIKAIKTRREIENDE